MGVCCWIHVVIPAVLVGFDRSIETAAAVDIVAVAVAVAVADMVAAVDMIVAAVDMIVAADTEDIEAAGTRMAQHTMA